MCKSRSHRVSNIELLRIIAMLLIVAHHYVVNSTVWSLFDAAHPTANSLFLQWWGMWGKTAINVFVLIFGYFMCTGSLTLRRFLKLFLEVTFYAWVMWIVLCCSGYETWYSVSTVKRLTLLSVVGNPNTGFVQAFLWMYLTIPIMNVLLKGATKEQLYSFLFLMITIFIGLGFFPDSNIYHHLFWYMTLYLLGAAIRLHPLQWMARNKVCLPLLGVSIVGAWASLFAIVGVAWYFNRETYLNQAYYFVADSHKIFAFAVALFAFLVFKNWKLGYSKLINAIASTCFGVLLIHAASNGMRKWLWQDFVNVPYAYSYSFWALVGYSIFVAIAVFAVCSVLDYFRIKFIEKYYLDFGERLCLTIWEKMKIILNYNLR